MPWWVQIPWYAWSWLIGAGVVAWGGIYEAGHYFGAW